MTKTETFVRKANNRHGSKYDYTKVSYIKAKEKVTIICKDHGEFTQAPTDHLSGRGCKACGYLRTSASRKSSTSDFIKKSVTVHGDKYDYSLVKYQGAKDEVELICQIHGKFSQQPTVHLSGCGCNRCGEETTGSKNSKPSDQFFSQCREIHKCKYTYKVSGYKHSLSKITITCPEHGVFTQLAKGHLRGEGCPKCADIRSTYYNKTLAIRHKSEYLDTPSGVYVMKMVGIGDDSVYKLGIAKDITRRLKVLASEIGQPPTLLYYAQSNLYASIITEQTLHDLLSEYNYISPVKFGGYTECFSLDDDLATDLIEYLNETFGEDNETHE